MVNIIIYDLLGRQVKSLINQTQEAGFKSVSGMLLMITANQSVLVFIYTRYSWRLHTDQEDGAFEII
jgi:hypothetical protein